MLDSSEFKYEKYKDSRVTSRPGFTVGQSGPLLMATHQSTGKKYLVKHTHPHNAVNEYVACWLAERMGVPTPKASLLTPNRAFSTKYAVAIEYLDGLRRFEKDHVAKNLRADLIAQFALCLMLRLDDLIQLSCTDEHIYSYDFSEGFNNVEMRYLLGAGEGLTTYFLSLRFQQFKSVTESTDFDIPKLALEFSLDPEELKNGMIAVVKRAALITNDDLDELSNEIMKMYPKAIAEYYQECIRAIREKAKSLE